MPLLPQFTFDANVSSDEGKQDKIEIQIGTWKVETDDMEDAASVHYYLGAPQPLSRRSRERSNVPGAHGWIFRTAHPQTDLPSRRKMPVRSEPLRLENPQGGEPHVVPAPLISDECVWQTRERGGRIISTATLYLSINPTRFVRHHPVPSPLPGGLCERPTLPDPPESESPLHPSDNWLPLSGRLFAHVKGARWREQVSRYLSTIERAFEGELSRACERLAVVQHVPREAERIEAHYNLTYVETYWEWLSDDPQKVVSDLQQFFRTFTRRKRTAQHYEGSARSSGVRREDEHNQTTYSAEISPGERLKIYAKTNRRIRVEIVHTLATDRGFRFPRERDTQGEVRRSTRHVFESHIGVLDFLDRLRERGATIVNEFLAYCGARATFPVAHVSAYYLLACIVRATPHFPTAIALASALIQRGNVSAGADDERQAAAIRALVMQGVFEPARRKTHEVTERFRFALRILREQTDFPLLTFTARQRRRSR